MFWFWSAVHCWYKMYSSIDNDISREIFLLEYFCRILFSNIFITFIFLFSKSAVVLLHPINAYRNRVFFWYCGYLLRLSVEYFFFNFSTLFLPGISKKWCRPINYSCMCYEKYQQIYVCNSDNCGMISHLKYVYFSESA